MKAKKFNYESFKALFVYKMEESYLKALKLLLKMNFIR